MPVRIIAGEKGSRRLSRPRGDRTRPTLERVRESLFMRLQPRLQDARVLDLFAGAGTLGLEALSRGAHEAVFVENWRPAIEALQDNIDRLDWSDRTQAIKADALRWLNRSDPCRAPFDLILADPPYGRALAARILERLTQRPNLWLAPAGIVVVQVGRRDRLDPAYGALALDSTRCHGETRIDIFCLREQSDSIPITKGNEP